MPQQLTYEQWLKRYDQQEASDYDMRAAYNAGLIPDSRGHLPDTYKKPNHITYSDESIYAKQPGAPPPGSWVQNRSNGHWTFWASPTNIANAGGADKLDAYFKNVEPDATLVLPNQPLDLAIRNMFSAIKPSGR